MTNAFTAKPDLSQFWKQVNKSQQVAVNGKRASTNPTAELRRLHHNNEVLMNALMKACGDDEQVVKDYIESQGELK